MAVSRTIQLDDLTPAEVAELFCNFDNHEQSRFFNAIGAITQGWPGASWCKQACSIIQDGALDDLGRAVVAKLGEHIAEVSQ